jgi:hypothetical protein
MRLLASDEDREKYLKNRDLIYYKLVGGLGNQLFGISRAHLLHKDLGKRVAIDISNLDHTSAEGPEWIKWQGLAGWSELVYSPTQLSPPKNLWNLANPPKGGAKGTTYFTGWKLSLSEVESSGLFFSRQLPFPKKIEQNHSLGIHMRGGDYRNAQGIGLLSSAYYRNAIKKVGINELKTAVIFTDDEMYAKSVIKHLHLNIDFVYSKLKSPLNLLTEMSICNNFIGSNSTLSWWAAYFSKAEQLVLPKPMYLQDWYADREIYLENALYLDRFSNALARISSYFTWKYIRS